MVELDQEKTPVPTNIWIRGDDAYLGTTRR
jgi:hypothetical protein